MNRRDLLRAMLGAAALTALPSEVWPFRKIFLPPRPQIYPTWIEVGWVSEVTFTPNFHLIKYDVLLGEIPKRFLSAAFRNGTLYVKKIV